MNSEKVKEIKEGLECLAGHKPCNLCSYHELAEMQETCCINVVAEEVIEYINELESENERLLNEKWDCQDDLDNYHEENKQLKDRIAELEKENEILQGTKDRITFVDRIKIADNSRVVVLKQFVERLKEKVKNFCGTEYENAYYDVTKSFACNDIDETLKEFIK